MNASIRKLKKLSLAAIAVALASPLVVLPMPVKADVTGSKNLVVLRAYFQDYANASRYNQVEVETLAGELDTLWRNTSYNVIDVVSQVSELFQLPDNRASYVDDFSNGDLSNGGKYMKVLNDAIANSPSGLDWSDVDAVAVLMAETDTSEFHRGQGNQCTVAMGPSGTNKLVGCAIFSENPSDTDVQVWGRMAHELGHAFQEGGPPHPSNYNSEFELMDSNMPGQTGVFEKQTLMGFPGWLPASKYLEFSATSNKEGQSQCIWAEEYNPDGMPNYQAIKARLSNSLYYLISVRRRVLGDDLNADSSGIPDEGVLIERVNEGADPWVVVQGNGGDRNKLWHSGESYGNTTDGVSIYVTHQPDEDNYCVTVRFNQGASEPDIALYPWLQPPGNTYETTDIWIDSPVNGYGTYRYGMWNDLDGGSVPVGNGDDPAVGLVNRLYARVRNWGESAATDVVVNWEKTEPLGLGIAGSNGWVSAGSVDKSDFPSLANIAPGAFVDVYVDWSPSVSLTPDQVAAGVFAYHSCVRVKLDAQSGELALGNQDGEREQENIAYFEASTAAPGPAYENSIRLRNDDLVNPKFFYLSYKSDLPDLWKLDINGGELGLKLAPGEVREIPVSIQPTAAAALGSVHGVDIEASSQRVLVNDLDPQDTHLEFKSLGGVRVEARGLQPTEIKCEASDSGEILVEGEIFSENFSDLIDKRDTSPVILLQGIDENGRYINARDASTVVDVGKDGFFGGYLYSEKPKIAAVRCLFAGTTLLGSSATDFIKVNGQ